MAEETLRSTAPSDAELITAVRSGDSRAYEELYRRHADAAMAVARHLTGNKADAEDVVAEAFTRVLSALQRGAGPEMAFRPYLLTSVRNAFYDRTRKDKRLDVTDEVPEDLGQVLAAAAASDDDAERAMAARAFASLPERWQLVLWHTEVEGMSPAEVGPLLGLAPNAVAALAYRAREGLRQAYLNAHVQTRLPPACAEIVPKLGAYVRNDLSNRDRRKVEEHLATCDRCPAIVAELQEADSHLRALLIPLVAGIPAAAYLGGIGGGAGGLVAFGSRVGKRFKELNPAGQVAAVVGALVVTGALVAGAVAVSSKIGGGANQTVAGPGGSEPAGTGTGGGSGGGGTGSGGGTGGAGGGTGGSAPGATGAAGASTVPPTASPTSPGGPPVVTVPPTGTTAPPTGTTIPTSAPTTTAAATTVAPTTTAPSGSTNPTTAPTTPTTAATTTAATTTTVPAAALSVNLSSAGPAYAGSSAAIPVSVANAAAPAVQTQAVASPTTGTASPTTGTASAAAGPANQPTLLLPLPAGTSFGSIDNPDWACTATTTELTCQLPALATGQTTSAIIQVTIAPTAPGTITLQASVSDSSGPPVTGPPLVITIQPAPPGVTDLIVDHADLALLGNAVVTCDPTIPGSQCVPARDDPAGAPPGHVDKQNQHMIYIDVDSDPATFNSSSATLTLPAGAEVLAANLLWGGPLNAGAGGQPAPDPTANGRVQLTAPGAGPVTVTASAVSPDPSFPIRYVAKADVTATVAGAGPGVYTVADLQVGTGVSAFGGWALQVIYRDAALPLQLVALNDQVTTVSRGVSATVSLGGIAPSTAARTGKLVFAAFEGDFGLTPESVTFNGRVLSNALNAPDNPLNGSISTPAVRNPAYVNNFGFDADEFATEIAPGESSADLVISTSADRARLVGIGLSFPV